MINNNVQVILTYSVGMFLTNVSPVFDIERICSGLKIATVNLAFKAGSSKHGNAFLALVG